MSEDKNNAAVPDANIILGRTAWIGALREALLGLPAEAGAATITLIDADFTIWPLDEPAVLDALTRWARPTGRLLRFIGADFATTVRRLPRLAAWRRSWAHRVEAWQPAPDEAGDLGSIMLLPGRGLQLLDAAHWRGRQLRLPADLRALAEACDAKLQRCEAAWPATTLGL